MADWKVQIKKLAEDFCISQVKVNRMLKRVEQKCSQRKMPSFYNGKENEYYYDNAQREFMNLIYA